MADLRYSKSQFKKNTRIEINASAIQLIHSITTLLVNGTRPFPTSKTGSGTALIIDYGPLNGIPSHSFRGISNHKFTSPFEIPGKQDLTADVDFGCIKDTAQSIPGAYVSGPISQGDWLVAMGLGFRADRMIKTIGMTSIQKENIRDQVKRLTGKGKEDMGLVYNVMSISSRESRSEGFRIS
jgi:SAM-dependent MidA family methyltransferase